MPIQRKFFELARRYGDGERFVKRAFWYSNVVGKRRSAASMNRQQVPGIPSSARNDRFRGEIRAVITGLDRPESAEAV
jgi:hypothetical protein